MFFITLHWKKSEFANQFFCYKFLNKFRFFIVERTFEAQTINSNLYDFIFSIVLVYVVHAKVFFFTLKCKS